jgi:hypothetical protein
MQRFDREQVISMLDEAAKLSGLTLDEFVAAGRSNRLEDPHLRELWAMLGRDLFDPVEA